MDGSFLSGQFSKLCLVTLTSIQDGHLQQTYCSFNIGPYGKNVLKSSPLKLVSQYSKHVIDGPYVDYFQNCVQ